MRRRSVTILVAVVAVAVLPWVLDRARGNVPIRFYGRVTDEGGQGVAGAGVAGFVVAERRLYVPVPWTSGSYRKPFRTFTDSDGRFQVEGMTGLTLHMQDIHATGYRVELRGLYAFQYSSRLTTERIHRPDPHQPVQFRAVAVKRE
jgi:protocatechuate 3,4-dioxygenase beta subunit